MPRLTQKFVDNVQLPATGQKFIRDDQLLGFALRLTAGCKAYIVEGRVRGSGINRRITLGKHGKLTPELARREAKQIIASMAIGRDPIRARKDRKSRAITLGEVRDKYLSIRSMSEHGRKHYTGLLNRCLGDWLNKPMTSITKEMIENRHRELTRKTRFGTDGKCQANSAMIALNTLFRFAIDYYETADGAPIITRNPVRRLSHTKQWHQIPRRQTIISDKQLSSWYSSLALVRPAVRDYLLLIMLTGLRRMEAARLKFEHVDWAGMVLTVPGDITKNRRTYQLPISAFLHALLLRRKDGTVGSEYIFPGQGGRGHLVDPCLDRLMAATNFKWTVHDLRRTFITACEKAGINHNTIKRLVNHIGGADVTTGYMIIDVEDLREPAAKVNLHLLGLMGAV